MNWSETERPGYIAHRFFSIAASERCALAESLAAFVAEVQ